MRDMKPYQGNVEKVCNFFQTNQKEGLLQKEAEKRIEQYGYNELEKVKPPSILSIFFSQFKDPLIYLLLLAATIIFFIGEPLDAFIISGILFFNAIIGTFQEKRTCNILTNLHTFLVEESIVVRNGSQQIIENRLLVPGDIIYIKAGERVPADARLLETMNLTVDESIFTGESQAVGKIAQQAKKDKLPLYDQNNMVFQGSYVLSGNATAVITATGNFTEAGKLHKSIETLDTNIPLKKELEKFAYILLMFVFLICGSLFIIGFLTGKTIPDLLVLLTALFICIVPEGLPVVITLVLVTGAHRMAKRNVLVKHLRAIEALGRVDVIITDKTGTLTRNEMMVSQLFINNEVVNVSGSGYFVTGTVDDYEKHKSTIDAIAAASSLLNDTKIEFNKEQNLFKIKGDPTQAAVYTFAQKVSPDFASIHKQFKTDYTIPFDSTSRYKAIFCSKDNENTAFVMGAPETLLSRCSQYSPEIESQLQNFLKKGFRVIVIAQKKYDEIEKKDLKSYRSMLEKDLTFLGLLAIHDSIRENIAPILTETRQANIKILMATGDHKETALHVAKSVNIADESTVVLTGDEFASLGDQEAVQRLKKTSVCARFSPRDKLRLVQLFHSQHKIVAMTGDGINDVPALVAADISIAMGNIGTELTKQASDIVLLEDSFDKIIYAIKQGRNIFFALRRTILYFLASNMGEVLIIFFALALNLPVPLLAAQILWLNLITDGFLDLALAMEPQQGDRLTKMDQDIPQNIFDRGIFYKMFYLSIPMALVGLFTFLHLY